MTPLDMTTAISQLRSNSITLKAEIARLIKRNRTLKDEVLRERDNVRREQRAAARGEQRAAARGESQIADRMLKYIYYRNLYFGLRAKFVKLHRELYEHFDEKVADVYYDTTPSIAEALGDEYGGEKDWYTKRRYDE